MSATSSISASDLVAVREAVKNAFRRPAMFGLDGRYSVMTAFLIGCDLGTKGALLDGFGDWLIQRHQAHLPEQNVSWEGLIVRLRRPNLSASYRSLDEDQSVPLVSFLRDQVEQFFDEQASTALSA